MSPHCNVETIRNVSLIYLPLDPVPGGRSSRIEADRVALPHTDGDHIEMERNIKREKN